MKFKRSITFFSVLLLMVVLGSCTDNFDAINTDPTSPTEVQPEALITRGMVHGALRFDVYQRGKHLYGNHYAQYYSNIQSGWGTDRYETRQDWLTAYWDGAYSDFGSNIQEALDITADDPDMVNIHNKARILRVWILHRVTDYWGDVPYFEAMQRNTQPPYDEQEEIYRDMLNELQEAEAALDEDAEFRLGSADVLLDGNLDMWRRFANSLRLRLAMRTSYADPVLAEEHVSDVLSGRPVLENNNHNVKLEVDPGGGTGDFVHDNHHHWIYRFDEYRISQTLADNLSDLEDPRLNVYLAPSDITGARQGLQNGLSDTQLSQTSNAPGLYSRETSYFHDIETPIRIMLASEVKFLEAEAALRGWGPGSPSDHYDEGIRASLEFYDSIDLFDIDQEEIDNYVNDSPATFNPSLDDEGQLEQIITQKWLAIFGQGMEAYAEIRRTGYPELQEIGDPSGGETDGELPRRIRYPNSEEGLNNDNLQEAIDRQGNDMLDRVWWDAKD